MSSSPEGFVLDGIRGVACWRGVFFTRLKKWSMVLCLGASLYYVGRFRSA